MPIADSAHHNPAEAAIVRAINMERRRRGLRTVRPRRGLARVADRHTRRMLRFDRLQHASFDGSSLHTRLRRAGYRRGFGEVLAWVPRGLDRRAGAVVALWMQSPPHAQQILDRRFTLVGAARRAGGMGGQRGFAFTVNLAN